MCVFRGEKEGNFRRGGLRFFESFGPFGKCLGPGTRRIRSGLIRSVFCTNVRRDPSPEKHFRGRFQLFVFATRKKKQKQPKFSEGPPHKKISEGHKKEKQKKKRERERARNSQEATKRKKKIQHSPPPLRSQCSRRAAVTPHTGARASSGVLVSGRSHPCPALGCTPRGPLVLRGYFGTTLGPSWDHFGTMSGTF